MRISFFTDRVWEKVSGRHSSKNYFLKRKKDSNKIDAHPGLFVIYPEITFFFKESPEITLTFNLAYMWNTLTMVVLCRISLPRRTLRVGLPHRLFWKKCRSIHKDGKWIDAFRKDSNKLNKLSERPQDPFPFPIYSAICLKFFVRDHTCGIYISSNLFTCFCLFIMPSFPFVPSKMMKNLQLLDVEPTFEKNTICLCIEYEPKTKLI